MLMSDFLKMFEAVAKWTKKEEHSYLHSVLLTVKEASLAPVRWRRLSWTVNPEAKERYGL